MVSESELEYHKAESWRKTQRDKISFFEDTRRVMEEARQVMEEARRVMEEARQTGRQEGEKFGVIHFCERLLKQPETPMDQLETLPWEGLTRLAEELEAQAMKRGSAT